jgi:uncharacterized protein YjbI with pentapeptide repeats
MAGKIIDMGERGLGLGVTITVAVAVAVCVSAGLLVFDPRSTGSDALRTGGLAGGSIVALYGLWLNDRRRRVTEQRQELEHRRADHDSDRVADENFARAIELLGHEADQVRVSALHALAGLARSRPDYTQTVLDVLCSYLRRPFQHPRYEPSASWPKEAREEAERMLMTRLTAQRLITGLLSTVDDRDSPAYDLDLTGAALEYFDVSGCRIGTLTLRYAQLFSSTSFNGCEFVGPAWCTAMVTGSGRLSGRFRCNDTTFHDRAWFGSVQFHNHTQFARTRFLGRAQFTNTVFSGELSIVEATFEAEADFTNCTFPDDADLTATTWRGKVITTGAPPALATAVNGQHGP